MVISVKLLSEQVKQTKRTGVSVNPADLRVRAYQLPEHYT